MRNKLTLAALTTVGSLALATSSHGALLAWYAFDGNGNDHSNNAPAAALNGTATFAGGPAPAVSGNLSSLDLGTIGNGASAIVPTGSHWDSAFLNNAMAVSFWQLNTQIGNSSAFWVHSPAASASDDRGFQAHTPWSNGTVFFDQSGCCAPSQRMTVNGVVTVNQWQHFVFQRDAAGNREIWVDGALAASAGGAEALDAFNGIMNIGASHGNNNSFSGSIDEFALWDDALTATEIADLAGGARIPEPSGTLLSLLGLTLLAVRRRRK